MLFGNVLKKNNGSNLPRRLRITIRHLPHTEGGFGVTFNDVTKDAAFYTTTSRFVAWLGAFFQERQSVWLPKDDLKD